MEAAPQVLPGEAKQMAFADRSIASALLDVATDAWVAVDRDLRLTYRNAAAATLLAGRRDRHLGADLRAVLPELADAAFIARCRRALADGRPASFAVSWPSPERGRTIAIHPLPGGLAI